MNFTPNPEQIKGIVRWSVTMFGGVVAGWFAARGWLNAQQVMDILNSPTFAGIIVSLVGGAFSLMAHTQANAVKVVDAMPEVAGVLTRGTNAGAALAESIPSVTVAVVGTQAAAALAAKRTGL